MYYSQCQSVTTSTIVKRRWHWSVSVKRRYTKYLGFIFSFWRRSLLCECFLLVNVIDSQCFMLTDRSCRLLATALPVLLIYGCLIHFYGTSRDHQPLLWLVSYLFWWWRHAELHWQCRYARTAAALCDSDISHNHTLDLGHIRRPPSTLVNRVVRVELFTDQELYQVTYRVLKYSNTNWYRIWRT